MITEIITCGCRPWAGGDATSSPCRKRETCRRPRARAARIASTFAPIAWIASGRETRGAWDEHPSD